MSETVRGLSCVFWGLLLTALDLKFDHWDVLPDPLGFALVALGALKLVRHSTGFKVVAVLCVVLAVFSLLDYVQIGEMGVPLGWIRMLLDLTMFWILFGGFMEFTTAQNWPERTKRASTLRGWFVVTYVATLSLALAVPEMAILAIVVGLVIYALMLHFIYQLKVSARGLSGGR